MLILSITFTINKAQGGNEKSKNKTNVKLKIIFTLDCDVISIVL